MKLALFLTSALTAAASPLVERQAANPNDPNAPCGVQPFGFGGPSGPAIAFRVRPDLQAAAVGAPTPNGYTAAFRNADGSSQQAGYQGFYTLESYNTAQCAELCDSTANCTAFNIYFERDPLLKPAPACPNPAGTVNIKCALYSQNVTRDAATNQGQTQQQFQILVAGSDGFIKT